MSTTVRALALPSGFVSQPESPAVAVSTTTVEPKSARLVNCAHCGAAVERCRTRRHPRVSGDVCYFLRVYRGREVVVSCFEQLDQQAFSAKAPRNPKGIKSSSKSSTQSQAARAARRAARTECPKGPTGSSQKYGPGKVGPQKAGMMNKGRAKK